MFSPSLASGDGRIPQNSPLFFVVVFAEVSFVVPPASPSIFHFSSACRAVSRQVDEMCQDTNGLDENSMVEFVSNTTMVG